MTSSLTRLAFPLTTTAIRSLGGTTSSTGGSPFSCSRGRSPPTLDVGASFAIREALAWKQGALIGQGTPTAADPPMPDFEVETGSWGAPRVRGWRPHELVEDV